MFKNILFFKFQPNWNQSLSAIESALDAARFVDLGASQERSVGWVEPRGEKHGPLIESVGGQWILKVMVESKSVPASVVKEKLKEYIEQTEKATGRKPGKKEKKEFSEELHRSLLPRAFPKKSTALVWIDPKSHFLVVEASSTSKADEIITLLVKSLTDFAVTLVGTNQSPAVCMSTWLDTQEAPAGFTIDRDCKLKACDESKSTVSYNRYSLDNEDVRAHIATGKMPTQLAMTWDSRVSFVLTDTGTIKKLEFLEVVFEGASQEKDSAFDADVTIATGELSKLIPDLLDALGGEADPAAITTSPAANANQ